MFRPVALSLVLLAASAGCEFVKVPVTHVGAAFTVAEATWFEEEQTLFFFYEISAQQGLGEQSIIEVSYRTDDVDQPWVELQTLPTVHEHVDVDCGSNTRCGSRSLHVVKPPRDLRLRLRYHREGQMILDSPLIINRVGTGPAHTNRSAIIYGVFNEQNLRVQWRARHQFPTLRNEDVQRLGLRRYFSISDPVHGAVSLPMDGNPYGYGFAQRCPGGLSELGWLPVETNERAVFHPNETPVPAYPSPLFCATSTVRDALGEFSTAALARKNPEVAPAFPSLRSPIQVNRMVRFFLRFCQRTLSPEHQQMQVQRLQLEGQTEVCVDSWAAPGFAAQLASQFQAAIDFERTVGEDMVLSFSLHHDDRSGGLADVVEAALAQVLPFENNKSSPRVSGAFVFDSFAHAISRPEVRRLANWCPANVSGDDLDLILASSERSCALMPDLPDIQLGPFRFSQLPILPTRAQYLTFINRYSVAQAGRTKSLNFSAPTRTPLSTNLPVGEFGVATFFNNEVLTAAPTDAFSVCPEANPASPVVFRISVPTDGGVVEDSALPLSILPDVHALFPQTNYPLGLLWDAPYLMRLEYEVVLAGAASAYSLTVPFGIYSTTQAYYGTSLWEQDTFPLDALLLRCSRFCDHPTFDSAGRYQVSLLFADTYRGQCYRPRYPVPGEGGFPSDP